MFDRLLKLNSLNAYSWLKEAVYVLVIDFAVVSCPFYTMVYSAAGLAFHRDMLVCKYLSLLTSRWESCPFFPLTNCSCLFKVG